MNLEIIRQMVDEKAYPEALRALDDYLFENPESAEGRFIFGYIMLMSDKPGLGLLAFKEVTRQDPENWKGWLNLGKCLDDLHKYKEAQLCYQTVLAMSKDNPIATVNMSTNAIHQCDPDRAIEWGLKAIELGDTDISAHVNLGFAYLHKGEYDKAWIEYEYGLGYIKYRDERCYTGEPRWDGSKGKCVVVYGEQGLGDQIMFAQAITEARRDCKSLVLDVNPKLQNLFERSFLVETHGDFKETHMDWPFERRVPIEANCAMSSLMKYYRDEPHKFTGKPYLIADINRRIQWRALLDTLPDRPNVGIAWTGGINSTQKHARSTTLETLLPMLRKDVNWISLEYNDRTAEIADFKRKYGIEIHDYGWATRTDDYDDTAALVAELDLVIAIPTTVVHLAGGLGIPCWCMVHQKPHAFFQLEGESLPWYESVKLYRRKEGWDVISTISEALDEFRSNYTDRAGTRGDCVEGSGQCEDSGLKQGIV